MNILLIYPTNIKTSGKCPPEPSHRWLHRVCKSLLPPAIHLHAIHQRAIKSSSAFWSTASLYQLSFDTTQFPEAEAISALSAVSDYLLSNGFIPDPTIPFIYQPVIAYIEQQEAEAIYGVDIPFLRQLLREQALIKELQSGSIYDICAQGLSYQAHQSLCRHVLRSHSMQHTKPNLYVELGKIMENPDLQRAIRQETLTALTIYVNQVTQHVHFQVDHDKAKAQAIAEYAVLSP